MAKLGGVFIDTVYEENPDRNVTITDHPIEDGVNITDHIKREPLSMSIRGVVSGPDAGTRKKQLETFMQKGDRLKYVYRNVLNNMVIESFSTTHDADVKQGFKFTMKLKQIEIAKKAQTTKMPIIKEPVSKGRQQVNSDKPKKTYKVKSGETTKSISQKTGIDEKEVIKRAKLSAGNPKVYPGQIFFI